MRIPGLAVLGSLILSAGAAQAAPPSADDIVNSLRPTSSQLRGPTRGIRPALTAPEPEQSSPTRHAGIHHRAEAPAVTDGDMPSVKLTVDFATGSTALRPQAEQTLDSLGHALTSPALEKFRFRIEGHTDTVGSAALNQTLSDERAKVVSAYLEQKYSIPASRLEPVGVGSSSLLVPTPDQTPEPRNRRVKIINLGS